MVCHPSNVINAGNLVRIEDGCATVTGYKLPSPLVPSGTGKAGARFEARKSGHQRGYARLVPPARDHFSDKEKDEASPLKLFFSGFVECLHSRFCRSLKAFLFSGFALVSQSQSPVERSVMRRKILLSLAAAGVVIVSIPAVHGSPYAAAVISYSPGSGYSPGYTNTSTVIGQPSPADSYGDATDPFDPPWQTNQILSIGAGGWVIVEFDHPIVHYPNGNRDFMIFGNSAFEVTNFEDPQDLWFADGKVINDAGLSSVSVSRDGVNFYTLNPSLSPTANYLYPTDASGDFRIPVNPALTTNDFLDLTLAQIRLLYNGSAGGASYNTAWAQDTNGNPVFLPDVRYVRVDVLANRLEIAGFAAVAGTVLADDFSNNPATDGWQTFGDANLFTWNGTNQDLQVTWDSSRANSYFYHPLGTIMTSNDAFSLSFDLELSAPVRTPTAPINSKWLSDSSTWLRPRTSISCAAPATTPRIWPSLIISRPMATETRPRWMAH